MPLFRAVAIGAQAVSEVTQGRLRGFTFRLHTQSPAASLRHLGHGLRADGDGAEERHGGWVEAPARPASKEKRERTFAPAGRQVRGRFSGSS
ncbi:MAG TPA: hypothetical protein VHG30_14625, partial [Microvirga sp.]|nr:hypothetical protein [Microvirga sp.]